ncbi:MAG: hypothetical protein ACRD2Y_06110 [Terriglobales bacterium]
MEKKTRKALNEPYFAQELTPPPAVADSSAPNVMFIDFLNRLDGPARVQIDKRQEMLIMALRQRCLRFALADDSDQVIVTLNQLCALYHQCAIKAELKVFEVFAAQNEQYIKVQEQFYYSRKQASAQDQRPVQETVNLLTYAHDLLEGFIRRVATLGAFSIDIIRDRERARTLSPSQYVEMDLHTKEKTFAEDPGIVGMTHNVLFGAVLHDIRNAIAHKRYEVQDDGSAVLWDYHPTKHAKKAVGHLTQSEIRDLNSSLERAVTVFEMSVLIFQHNNGAVLHQLGHYEAKGEYTEKHMREMLYLSAPGCFMRIEDIEVHNDEVIVNAEFLSFENSPLGGEVYVSSKDRSGKPVKYALPVPRRELSARDQTLRLLQVASLYCRKYKRVTIRTKDVLGGKPLGEVSAGMDLLVESLEGKKIPKQEFLKRLTTNTFPGDATVSQTVP